MDSVDSNNHSDVVFSNNQVEVAHLPNFEEVKLQPLQAKYLIIKYFNALLFLIFFLIIASIIYYFKENFNWVLYISIMGSLILFTLIRIILTKLTFNKRGYAVRDHDIIYKSGVILETTTIVPLKNIQFVAFNQGFFERKFNLASLEVFTAGGEDASISLNGIKKEEALQIKKYVHSKMKKNSLEETDFENE